MSECKYMAELLDKAKQVEETTETRLYELNGKMQTNVGKDKTKSQRKEASSNS
jgi:hypothetical protein